jgi:hypothetical protein
MNEETFVDETPRQQIAGNTAKRDNREPENLGDYKKYTAEADKAEMEREVEVQADKIHLQVVTPDKKYTFISYNDDYVIHCLRYGQPWMTFAKGHKAISSLLHIIDSLTAERDRLRNETMALKDAARSAVMGVNRLQNELIDIDRAIIGYQERLTETDPDKLCESLREMIAMALTKANALMSKKAEDGILKRI